MRNMINKAEDMFFKSLKRHEDRCFELGIVPFGTSELFRAHVEHMGELKECIKNIEKVRLYMEGDKC